MKEEVEKELDSIMANLEKIEINDNSDLLKTIQELNRALEAGEYSKPSKDLVNGASLQIKDQMWTAIKYLTDCAAHILYNQRGKSLVECYNVEGVDGTIRHTAVCLFYTTRVRRDRIEEGVKEISETINQLAERGAIHSCLSPIASVDLADMMFEFPSSVVLCYVHIKPEHMEFAKSLKYNTMEGGIGPSLHNFDSDLQPGEFLADGTITNFVPMDGSYALASKDSKIFERVQEYLKYLPEGTKFLGYRECTIISLAMPIEFKFYNPLFKDIKRVDLSFLRSVTFFEDAPEGQQLKQWNRFIGMRYYQKNPLSGNMEWSGYPENYT